MTPLVLAIWSTQLVPALVLAAFVTVIAYIHDPRLKVLIFSMPVPFTCAYLAAGKGIDATYITGLGLSVVYHWTVYFTRPRIGLPLAIITGLTIFVTSAMLIRPMASAPFLPVVAVFFTLWAVGVRFYRPVGEQGHRSQAPVWVKFPAIFAVACVVFGMSSLLAGAVTTFPYAGMFTSYEMRRSLRTLAGQYMINVATFAMMVTVMWTVRRWDFMPRPLELFPGWIVVVTSLLLIHRLGYGRPMPMPVAAMPEEEDERP